jgi:hypothetical protein
MELPMRAILIALPLLLAASACVKVNATRLGSAPVYDAVPRAEVRVYASEADLPRPYEKVALVFAHGGGNESKMIEAARRRAAKLGANALVVGEFDDAPVVVATTAEGTTSAAGGQSGRFLAVRVTPR